MRSRLALVALAVAAVGGAPLTACGAPAPPVTPDPDGVQPPPPAGAGSSAVNTAAVQAEAEVQRTLESVANLRSLRAKGPVRARIASRRELVDFVRGSIRREIPPAVVRGQQEFLVGLGVVPLDFDLERSLLDLMGEQLAGLYDPREKVMLVASDLAGPEAHATLVHELVHALQDQHWQLGDKIEFRVDAGDSTAAVHALAEGDATSLMLDDALLLSRRSALDLPDAVVSAQLEGGLIASASSVPTVIQRSVLAPYLYGTLLVHSLRRAGGWSAVDAAWADPPTTTEQLLHPERYARREPAVPVAVPAAPPGGPATELFRDVMGELSVRLVFEEWLPTSPARDAAAGWGGDRAACWTDRADGAPPGPADDERLACAWSIVLDDDDTAHRAALTFARGALRAAGRSATREDGVRAFSRGHACAETPTGPFAVARSGRELGITLGPWRRRGTLVDPAGDCALGNRWAAALVQ